MPRQKHIPARVLYFSELSFVHALVYFLPIFPMKNLASFQLNKEEYLVFRIQFMQPVLISLIESALNGCKMYEKDQPT